jgi:hypothetical protein
MRLLAAEASGRVDSPNAANFLPSIVGVPVLVFSSHLVFQHPAHQFGNSRILFSRLLANPSSRFLANPDPDTLQHEISVALNTLIPGALRLSPIQKNTCFEVLISACKIAEENTLDDF